MQADAAYEARRQRREAWVREDPARATSHAVSVAAESHVLTTPLRPWLGQEVELAASRLTIADEPAAGSAVEAEERARRQAELHRQLAYERRDNERTPGAERSTERVRESEAGR